MDSLAADIEKQLQEQLLAEEFMSTAIANAQDWQEKRLSRRKLITDMHDLQEGEDPGVATPLPPPHHLLPVAPSSCYDPAPSTYPVPSSEEIPSPHESENQHWYEDSEEEEVPTFQQDPQEVYLDGDSEE